MGPTQSLINAYDTLSTDARLPWNIQPDPSGGGYVEGTQAGGSYGTKFPTPNGAEDFHAIRFAEVLLIKAEALARQNQLDSAVATYNLIRVRAALPPHVLGIRGYRPAAGAGLRSIGNGGWSLPRKGTASRTWCVAGMRSRCWGSAPRPAAVPDSAVGDRRRTRGDSEPGLLRAELGRGRDEGVVSGEQSAGTDRHWSRSLLIAMLIADKPPVPGSRHFTCFSRAAYFDLTFATFGATTPRQ